ncbi:tetratricopeptide repeat protein [Marinilabilia rubra]|uniref:Tetratricopeptide repeat protein n=1 Tax=Marinilabilia rubra TaxID=2162893 RepID=A0A2U2B4S1_9BACT|nr:hypothetical protein [Marinilabilia rubra]PWD98034.1 hypothetical protein DDZ16_17725 [Marinilabilia rubra]
MSFKTVFFCVAFVALVLVSCDPPGQIELREQLVRIDTLLKSKPELAFDSLSAIDKSDLGEDNKAYSNLLDVITRHKLYIPFENDSLISKTTEELKGFPPDRNYFRSLVYQGMVRYGLESVPDSLVLLPLKEAERILAKNVFEDEDKTRIKLFFFLGLVHQDNKNYEIGKRYFEKALKVASRIDDVENVVNISILLFWSHLRKDRFNEAEQVLTSLDSLKNLTPELRYDVINAKAGYNYTTGDFRQALSGYQELEKLVPQVKGEPRVSNIYYSMYLSYRGMAELDSAMVYAKKAVENISKTDVKYDNFYLYVDFADIALKNGEFEIAAKQYKNAFLSLKEASEKKTEKRILELEKKYDLSQARVEALKQRQKFQRFLFIAGALFLALSFVFLIYHLNLKKSRLELENERILRESAEKEAAGTIRQNQQREHLLKFYKLITQREMVTQERFDLLSQKYIKEDPIAYNDLQTELFTLKEEFSGMMYDLMNDELFYSNLNLPEDFQLTDSEKVMLFLMYYEMPTTEIATVLGISTNNFRVRKSNLKKRMTDHLENYPSMKNVVSLF